MSLENSRSQALQESLSALLDNEADELEIRRLLKNAEHDNELAQSWRRFNVVSSILHHEELAPVSSAVSQRIFDAIEAEPAYSSSDSKAKIASVGTVWEGFGRLAIAASVALAAFITFQNFVAAPELTAPVAVQNAPQSEAVQLAEVANAPVEFDFEAQQRLNDYIESASIRYNDNSSTRPQFNILEDSQLIRQVNQIEQ